MSYTYPTGAVLPHTAFRFKVELYNLLHKLHDMDHIFSQQVMSAELNCFDGRLKVKVRSPVDGALDEFLELLHKDKAWLLRVILLDSDGQPTIGYRLNNASMVAHKLSLLSYAEDKAVYHEFEFSFFKREYERLSPSLRELAPEAV